MLFRGFDTDVKSMLSEEFAKAAFVIFLLEMNF